MDAIFEEYRAIIPDFSGFQGSLQRPMCTHLRINRLRIEPRSLLDRLERKGVKLERSSKIDDSLFFAPGLTSPGNLPEYFSGYLHPQALTSCLAAIALDPAPEAFVLDLCAAPGGKTSHVAQLMGNTGLIVANELYPGRHAGLGHTLSRLGVLNTIVTGYQAQQFPMKQRFDYVLADVPCSGEGRFRKIGENGFYQTRKSKLKLPDLQKKILLRGFDLLKEDGVLLYATCTYNPDENESVIQHLLTERDARLLPVVTGVSCEPGLTKWRGRRYDVQVRKSARFYPHRLDSVGFFMARIGRRT